MKQGHLALMFLAMYSACFLFLYIEQSRYDEVQEEKQKVEQALIDGLETAGREYTAVLNASEEKKKQTLEKVFLESVSVSLGMFTSEEEQEILRMYLPMMVLAEEDGAFFFYIQEQYKDGKMELCHVWSEKIPYEFPEDSTEAQRKSVVAETLETNASDIITKHNYIAFQYGISYSFFVPDFLQDTSEIIKFPMLFVVFQGWPLTASGDIVYENCIDAGVYLQEVERYLVERPESISRAVSFYHRDTCSRITGSSNRFYEEYVTEKEAVRIYGAFPCSECVYGDEM